MANACLLQTSRYRADERHRYCMMEWALPLVADRQSDEFDFRCLYLPYHIATPVLGASLSALSFPKCICHRY